MIADPARPPARLGDYRIERALGRGSMGRVYQARAPRSRVSVAIKWMPRFLAGALDGARREIAALERLRHPGVVRILAHGTDRGHPWYAMEHLHGATLDVASARLRRRRDEEADRAVLSIVRRLCSPLAYLHGEGVVHRDLRPRNVLVTARREPVIVDFGLAATAASGRETLTGDGSSGTAAYMAPEQVQGDVVDGRADLYSLGCILFELLCGRPPFAGASVPAPRAHLLLRPPRPSSIRAGIPAALDQLVRALLEKRPEDRVGHAGAVAEALTPFSDGTPLPTAPAPRPFLYRPPLTGREGLLTRCEESLARLDLGSGGVLLLVGESGAGKTRLAVELVKRARAQGYRVVVGGCPAPPGPTRPLAPLSAALDLVAERCGPRGSVPDDVATVLAPLHADIARRLGGIEPSRLPGIDGRNRLLLALADAFSTLAEERPLLLVVDDLQWADELSVSALERLADHAPAVPMLVVATLRTEDTEPAALRGHPAVTRIAVPRLERADTRAMASAMLAIPTIPDTLAAHLEQDTEGIPFYVAEYLRAAVTAGLLVRSPAGRWEPVDHDWRTVRMPGAIRDLIGGRLARLTRSELRVARVAAVAGRELSLARLASGLGRWRASMDERVTALLGRQILEETSPGTLRFVHDKVRAVVYDSTPEAVLRRLHGRMARLLDGDPDTRTSGESAAHWERAGDRRQASRAHARAARRDARGHALGDAATHYRKAIALAVGEPRRRARLRLELARDVLLLLGQTDSCMRELGRARAAAARHRVRGIEAEALIFMANIESHVGALARSLRTLRRAARLAGRIGRLDLVSRARQLEGETHRERGDLPAALATLEEAAQAARRAGDHPALARTLGAEALVHAERGNYVLANDCFKKAARIQNAGADRLALANTLTDMATVGWVEGRTMEAVPLYEQALALQRRIGYRRGEAIVLSNLGGLLATLDDVARGRELLEQALRLHREVNDRTSETSTLSTLANIHRDQGRVEEARALYREAIAGCDVLGNRPARVRTLLGLAELERITDPSGARARAVLRELDSLLRDVELPAERVAALCEHGLLALARGRLADAILRRAERLAAGIDASPASLAHGSIARLRAAIDDGRRSRATSS